jgi:hypothetical protein
LGDYKKSEEGFLKALKIDKKFYGKEHLEYGITL